MEGITRMKTEFLTALIVFTLLMPFLFSGCSDNPEGEGFAIYLTRDDIPVSQMEALSHVEIADEPVLSLDDIVSYDWDTHEIELTPDAFDRLDAMRLPTNGVPFLVCVDKAPVYWGAFWPPYSSQSFDGVTIMVLSFAGKENTVQIALGYPSGSLYQGIDPRGDDNVKTALEAAGKLK